MRLHPEDEYTSEDLYGEDFYHNPDDNIEKEKEKFDIKDVGRGAKIMQGHGNVGKFFFIAVIAIFILILLKAFNVIPNWAYIVILVVFTAIVLYYFYKSHENDEDTLD